MLDLDIFGKPVELRIDEPGAISSSTGRTRFGSLIGLFLTVIAFIALIMYFMEMTTHLTALSMYPLTSTRPVEDDARFGNENGFNIAFALTNYYNPSEKEEIDKVATLKVSVYQWGENSKGEKIN